MRKDESKEFSFEENGSDKYSDAFLHDEMKDMRVEKLNQRVTIITILIPCLIGVILFIAYREITGRVTQSEFSGSKEVQALSAELENKLTNLNEQNSEFQASLTAKIAGIEKAVAGLDNKLQTLNGTLKKIKQDLDKTGTDLKSVARSKVDKKDQKTAMEKINNTLIPIRKDLEGLALLNRDISSLSNKINFLSSSIKAMDQHTHKEFTSVTATMTKTSQDLEQLQSDLTVLGNQKMDQASLELELLKARKSYERTLDQELGKLQRKMDALQKRTKRLETNLKQLEATATTIPVAKPPGKTKTTKDTKIEEQDLKE